MIALPRVGQITGRSVILLQITEKKVIELQVTNYTHDTASRKM